ncbi:hypothetical protein ACF0H5_018515 [Mactra antiquata]
MLRRLFAKKSRGSFDQEGTKTSASLAKSAYTSEHASKPRQPLSNVLNNSNGNQKENLPNGRNKTLENKDKHDSDQSLNLMCTPCRSSGDVIKAEGYCTDCKQFVCSTCIDIHYMNDSTIDHIILKLILITRHRKQRTSEHYTDLDDYRHTMDRVNDEEEVTTDIDDFDDSTCGEIMENTSNKNEHTTDDNTLNELSETSRCNIAISSEKSVSDAQHVDQIAVEVPDHGINKQVNTEELNVSPDIPSKSFTPNNRQDSIKQERNGIRTPENKDTTNNSLMTNSENKTSDSHFKIYQASDVNKEVNISMGDFVNKFDKECQNSKKVFDKVIQSGNKVSEECNGDGKKTSVCDPTLLVGNAGNEKDIVDVLHQNSEHENTKSPSKFNFTKDIKIKYEGDIKNCFISGIAVLSDKRIAVLDHNNQNIKTVHIDWGIDGVIQFSNYVGDITPLPSEQIAVTIPVEKRIKILSTINGISVVANIRFLQEYYHIVYCNGKLLVSMQEPLQFRVLGLDGIMLCKIIPSPDVETYLTTVREYMCLTMSKDEKHILVSNKESNFIVAIDMKGELVAANNVGLDHPIGITVANGDVHYVCNKDKHTVHKMSKDLKESSVILSEKNGLWFPSHISFYPSKNYLFISSQCDDRKNCDKITMFEGMVETN